MEIMLSGNFKEENIICIKTEIENLSMKYREIYGRCSMYLEKLISSSLETTVIKGLGTASKTVGKFIDSIPIIKEGVIDEFLQDNGVRLEKMQLILKRKL